MSTTYRVLVSFDPEKKQFLARAPELEHCVGEGATRAEAIAKVEEEIEATVANIKERGGRVPAAIDEDEGVSGELALKLSRSLHRELAWQARQEGVELAHLAGEILAAGLEARRQRGARRPGEQQGGREHGPDRGDRGGGRDRRGPGNDGRYHNIMDNGAAFREYVRDLERGGGRPPGGGGGGGRRDRDRRGPGGPGGPGGRPPRGGDTGGGNDDSQP
jgi:predicted RNase H-like HicB family nuclease